MMLSVLTSILAVLTMSTLTNAPYHHGDLRNALLEAALVILNRDGEAGLQLRDLARAVNVSPAAPYRHFDSRAALLEALAVTGFTRFTRMMEDLATNQERPRLAMAAAKLGMSSNMAACR